MSLRNFSAGIKRTSVEPAVRTRASRGSQKPSTSNENSPDISSSRKQSRESAASRSPRTLQNGSPALNQKGKGSPRAKTNDSKKDVLPLLQLKGAPIEITSMNERSFSLPMMERADKLPPVHPKTRPGSSGSQVAAKERASKEKPSIREFLTTTLGTKRTSSKASGDDATGEDGGERKAGQSNEAFVNEEGKEDEKREEGGDEENKGEESNRSNSVQTTSTAMGSNQSMETTEDGSSETSERQKEKHKWHPPWQLKQV